ncbi:hypothetical protein D3C81_954520 [compost metagenome]
MAGLFGRHQKRTGTGERIADDTTRRNQAHHFACEPQGLFRHVALRPWQAFGKHAGQVDFVVGRHGTLCRPHHELGLLGETAQARPRAAGHLVPDRNTSPDEARALNGIGQARQLSPVGKADQVTTFLGRAKCFAQPAHAPKGP